MANIFEETLIMEPLSSYGNIQMFLKHNSGSE